MRTTFIAASFAGLFALMGAAAAQPASSAGKMGAAKPIGVSASTAAEAQQKAASDASSVGSVVRTSEGPDAKASRAKNGAMNHTKTNSSVDQPGAAASGAPMSK